jgi:hypothetical protein
LISPGLPGAFPKNSAPNSAVNWGRIVQHAKPALKTPLRERNHIPRKPAPATGEILGVRPLYLAIAALAAIALIWFLNGWWTYPVAP